MAPDFGTEPSRSTEVDAWEKALRLHARHQRAYVGKEADLAGCGCLSRPLDLLRLQFDALLADDLRAVLAPADRDRLRAVAGFVRAAIADLGSCGIPNTVLHGDLHAANVAIGRGRPIFFDWTDASISHPFLDLATFLQPARLFAEHPNARDRLRAAYLDGWRGVAPPAAVTRPADHMIPSGLVDHAGVYHAMVVSLTGRGRDDVSNGAAQWLKGLIAWA